MWGPRFPQQCLRGGVFAICSDQSDAALPDAMQTQCVHPDGSTAFHILAVALAKLDMHKAAADMLNEAAALEEKRQQDGRGP
ncbi:hypothetical protein Acr_00g0019980 [Actinidia rufa]|uniref:Uncharacterized protein n=1 Tax=Actinidia rufa TaxID=165716 RepID=A0A7J0DC60_9ERIC|nr:hypothetical protein Acr_00g0019980 [Actinidia rufa]